MDRPTFERLRDLPDKAIHGEIRLVARRQTSPALVADNIAIENSAGVDLRLNVSYNPEVGSKTFNVIEVGNGPICRLDVDGTVHAPAGRSHKHSLQTDRCPASNLPNGVVARPDLAGQSPAEVFAAFREMAGIAFDGTFVVPEAP